jgi:hypothetical protein
LDGLDEADLTICYLTASLLHIVFHAHVLYRGEAFVYLSGPTCIDLPCTMHDVRMRIAAPEEADSRLSPVSPEEAEPASVVLISCHEGHYWLSTTGGSIYWVSEMPEEELKGSIFWEIWSEFKQSRIIRRA